MRSPLLPNSTVVGLVPPPVGGLMSHYSCGEYRIWCHSRFSPKDRDVPGVDPTSLPFRRGHYPCPGPEEGFPVVDEVQEVETVPE